VTFTQIENLLAARLGFDVHSVGRKAVETTLKRSMKDAGFSDPAAYARTLTEDSEAWNALVEKVVVPETWFFRDAAPFAFAEEFARARLSNGSSKVLRILSCPCATGEEPYSLAMTMLHAGVPAESFTVDALDVSRRALASAQDALFSGRSFRDHALWCRKEYFDLTDSRRSWRLRSPVKSLVRFRHGNLISPEFLADAEPYDLIFCRNLLIYLHSEARVRAMTALRRMLAKDGALVLGHAEAAFAREHGFKPAGSPAAFAFVDRGVRSVPKLQVASRRNVTVNFPPPLPVATQIALAVIEPPREAAILPQESELLSLAVARRLGDSGQLQDALHECGEYLERVPDSVEGHFLLGVLYDALGHIDLAVKSFRKALYLDPTHREALLHLAVKHEARGEGQAATLLRERARRAASKNGSE